MEYINLIVYLLSFIVLYTYLNEFTTYFKELNIVVRGALISIFIYLVALEIPNAIVYSLLRIISITILVTTLIYVIISFTGRVKN